jgi:hypothetical protein
LGQKQTFAMQNAMSALPPKADMCGATSDVRFVPIADIDDICAYLHARREARHTFMPMRSNLMNRICLGSALRHPKVLQSRPDCA